MLKPKEIYHPSPLSTQINYERKRKAQEARDMATKAGMSQSDIDRAASYACNDGITATEAVNKAKQGGN